MAPELVTPTADPVNPLPTEAPPEESSVASHAEQFDPKREPPLNEDDNAPAPSNGRHRAKSQRATAEDVPRIAELTKKLRAAEAERDEWKGKATPKAPALPAVDTSVSAFTEKEPTLEDFPDAADPYLALTRATAKWDRKKEAFDAEQITATARQQASSHAAQEAFTQEVAAHLTRTQAFAKATPDFETVTAALREQQLPPVLIAAIVKSDNSPALVYHLAQHPDDLDDLYLLSDGKSASDESVAILQRRLHKLFSQAAPTGSVAGVPHKPAPRPPNPVRTAPMKMGDDPPSDDHSVAEHAKFYGPKRR